MDRGGFKGNRGEAETGKGTSEEEMGKGESRKRKGRKDREGRTQTAVTTSTFSGMLPFEKFSDRHE